MNLALPLMALGPAGAAFLILAGGGGARFRRVVCALGLAAGLGASIAVLIETLDAGSVHARGLTTDPWRAGLALGALAVAAAGALRLPDGRVFGLLVSAGAAAGSFIVADLATFSGLLVVTTAAAVLAAGPEGMARAARAAGWFVLGDLAVIAGLIMTAGDGLQIPPTMGTWPAALLLSGALIRTGAVPFTRSLTDEPSGHPAASAILAGPMRAQGFMLAGWVVLSGGAPADAAAIAGAIAAAVLARRAVRESSASVANAAAAALVLTGLGLGGVAATWGAIVLAAGVFLGAMLALLDAGRTSSPSIAVAPLGATLPGAALVCSAALARAPASTIDVVVAVAAAMCLAWLVIAGVAGVRAGAGTSTLWGVLPAAAALAVAVVPGRAARAIAEPVGPLLGVGRPLTELPGFVPDDLGVLFAAAAVGGLVAATRRTRAGEVVAFAVVEEAPLPRAVLGGLGIAAMGVVALLWVGIGRGFI